MIAFKRGRWRTAWRRFFLEAGSVASMAGLLTPDGFRIPEPHPKLHFPRDHGSHFDFRIEWWYLTGHLSGGPDGQRRFGVQATFFRLAQRPGEEKGAVFGAKQIYLAHMAVCDSASGLFHHEERLNRSGWDAGASADDLDVWNGNWSLRRTGEARGDGWMESMRLTGSVRSDVRFELDLVPRKPPVLFGKDGVSRKGAAPEAASLYLTFPRIGAAGHLIAGGERYQVTGELWMDHEISSSQLGRDQTGWDWVSIQFRDGRELMAYVLRRQDGTPDPCSLLAWVDEAGKLIQFESREFRWEPGGWWQSTASGARYPIRPSVRVADPATGMERRFTLRPLMADQELRGALGGISYWEGACDVLDEAGVAVGRAYLELTGYAPGQDLNRRLRGEARKE